MYGLSSSGALMKGMTERTTLDFVVFFFPADNQAFQYEDNQRLTRHQPKKKIQSMM